MFRLVFKEIGTIKGSISKNRDELDRQKYMKLISEYRQFKKNEVQHFRFDSAAHTTAFGKLVPTLSDANENKLETSGEKLPPSILQLVQIYFDTATFDNIERDKKIKTEAQLSLIGGTMGLLTGFSIISGIEIIFFIFRLSISSQQYFKFMSSQNG